MRIKSHLLLLAIPVLVASCSSVKKTTSSQRISRDSTVTKTVDSSTVKKAGEITSNKHDSAAIVWLSEKDSDRVVIDLNGTTAGHSTGTMDIGFRVTDSGSYFKVPVGTKSVTITRTHAKASGSAVKVTTMDSTAKIATDSTALRKKENVAVHITDDTKISSRRRVGSIIGGSLLLLLLIALYLYWQYRRKTIV